jgi:hypothetical protein
MLCGLLSGMPPAHAVVAPCQGQQDPAPTLVRVRIGARSNAVCGRDIVLLLPGMTVKELIALFDTAQAEALAVVEAGDRRHAIGLLTEAHARRRVRMLEPRLGDAQRGRRICFFAFATRLGTPLERFQNHYLTDHRWACRPIGEGPHSHQGLKYDPRTRLGELWRCVAYCRPRRSRPVPVHSETNNSTAPARPSTTYL